MWYLLLVLSQSLVTARNFLAQLSCPQSLLSGRSHFRDSYCTHKSTLAYYPPCGSLCIYPCWVSSAILLPTVIKAWDPSWLVTVFTIVTNFISSVNSIALYSNFFKATHEYGKEVRIHQRLLQHSTGNVNPLWELAMGIDTKILSFMLQFGCTLCQVWYFTTAYYYDFFSPWMFMFVKNVKEH